MNLIDFVPISVPLSEIVIVVDTGVVFAPLLTVKRASFRLVVRTSFVRIDVATPDHETPAPFVDVAERYDPVSSMSSPYLSSSHRRITAVEL